MRERVRIGGRRNGGLSGWLAFGHAPAAPARGVVAAEAEMRRRVRHPQEEPLLTVGAALDQPLGQARQNVRVVVVRVRAEVACAPVTRVEAEVVVVRDRGLGRGPPVTPSGRDTRGRELRPLAHHRRLVARGSKPYRQGLTGIDQVQIPAAVGVGEVPLYAGVVRVLAGEERRAGGAAERIRGVEPREAGSLGGEKALRLRHDAEIRCRLIVRHQHQDVRPVCNWPRRLRRFAAAAAGHESHGDCQPHHECRSGDVLP